MHGILPLFTPPSFSPTSHIVTILWTLSPSARDVVMDDPILLLLVFFECHLIGCFLFSREDIIHFVFYDVVQNILRLLKAIRAFCPCSVCCLSYMAGVMWTVVLCTMMASLMCWQIILSNTVVSLASCYRTGDIFVH